MFEKTEEFLVKVLTIIEYKKDKKKFAKEFVKNCVNVSISRLIDGFSQKKKGDFYKEYKQVDKSREEVIKRYFEKDFPKIYEETFKSMFEDFIKSIKESLSQEKREELKEFLKRMVK